MAGAAVTPEDEPARHGGPAYRWYLLILLTLVYTFHSMDRGIPGLLVEPIRHEFHLSDAQLGLYSGAAYGFAFAITVLPMGYLSDRTNRRNFLVGILLLWSAATALGGFVRSYAQLLFTRIAVGASESGAVPVVVPIVTDLFPIERRSLAMGILYVGVPMGGILGNAVGGYITSDFGWRAALLFAGAPGLVVALLLLLTTKRTIGEASRTAGTETEAAPSIPETGRFLARQPALLFIILAASLIGAIWITVIAWSAAFFVRVHGLSIKQYGLTFGLLGGPISVAAPILYGWVGDRLARRHFTAPITLAWICAAAAMGLGMFWLFAPTWPLAMAGLILVAFAGSNYTALLFPVLMEHTPARMRGGVMSMVQFFTNLLGWGIGPTLVGLLSDALGGGKAIRYALAFVMGVYVIVVLMLIASARQLSRAQKQAALAGAA